MEVLPGDVDVVALPRKLSQSQSDSAEDDDSVPRSARRDDSQRDAIDAEDTLNTTNPFVSHEDSAHDVAAQADIQAVERSTLTPSTTSTYSSTSASSTSASDEEQEDEEEDNKEEEDDSKEDDVKEDDDEVARDTPPKPSSADPQPRSSPSHTPTEPHAPSVVRMVPLGVLHTTSPEQPTRRVPTPPAPQTIVYTGHARASNRPSAPTPSALVTASHIEPTPSQHIPRPLAPHPPAPPHVAAMDDGTPSRHSSSDSSLSRHENEAGSALGTDSDLVRTLRQIRRHLTEAASVDASDATTPHSDTEDDYYYEEDEEYDEETDEEVDEEPHIDIIDGAGDAKTLTEILYGALAEPATENDEEDSVASKSSPSRPRSPTPERYAAPLSQPAAVHYEAQEMSYRETVHHIRYTHGEPFTEYALPHPASNPSTPRDKREEVVVMDDVCDAASHFTSALVIDKEDDKDHVSDAVRSGSASVHDDDVVHHDDIVHHDVNAVSQPTPPVPECNIVPAIESEPPVEVVNAVTTDVRDDAVPVPSAEPSVQVADAATTKSRTVEQQVPEKKRGLLRRLRRWFTRDAGATSQPRRTTPRGPLSWCRRDSTVAKHNRPTVASHNGSTVAVEPTADVVAADAVMPTTTEPTTPTTTTPVVTVDGGGVASVVQSTTEPPATLHADTPSRAFAPEPGLMAATDKLSTESASEPAHRRHRVKTRRHPHHRHTRRHRSDEYAGSEGGKREELEVTPYPRRHHRHRTSSPTHGLVASHDKFRAME